MRRRLRILAAFVRSAELAESMDLWRLGWCDIATDELNDSGFTLPNFGEKSLSQTKHLTLNKLKKTKGCASF